MSFNYYNIPPPPFNNSSMPYGQPRPPAWKFLSTWVQCLTSVVRRRHWGYRLETASPSTIDHRDLHHLRDHTHCHRLHPMGQTRFGRRGRRLYHNSSRLATVHLVSRPGPLPGAPPYAEPRVRGNRPTAGPGYTPRWNGQRFNRAHVQGLEISQK
jgi:hypothetical protein